MDRNLLLDIQRKVIGGYINAEEFSIKNSHKEILSTKLDERLFDDFIHKAIARACSKLKDNDIPITEYTVLEFLHKHNLPKGTHQEAEYLTLMTEHSITTKTFNHYINMILQHKLES